MTTLIRLLAENQLLLLFVVIGLGYLLGSIRVFGFQLGVVAVLFVGIAIGALDKRLSLPEHIYIIGLVLFVYAIGLHSGPGFFTSFRKRGLRANLLTIAVLTGAAAITVVTARWLGFSAAVGSGLFCGALTNTPALAATVEVVKSMTMQAGGDVAAQAAAPVVAYGLAYPFGVLGRWEFPARGDQPPVAIHWYDGGLKPARPPGFEAGRAIGQNLFIGDQGMMLDYRLVPEAKMKAFGRPKEVLPRSPGHYREFVDACRGGPAPGANIVDHAGLLSEVCALGNVALRSGKKLAWDGPNFKVTNDAAANRLLHRDYRLGWTL